MRKVHKHKDLLMLRFQNTGCNFVCGGRCLVEIWQTSMDIQKLHKETSKLF